MLELAPQPYSGRMYLAANSDTTSARANPWVLAERRESERSKQNVASFLKIGTPGNGHYHDRIGVP